MNRIVIDVGIKESRIAIIEEGILVEVFLERDFEKKILGNIYRGKLVNRIESMESSFIDIGLNKNGYLNDKDANITNSKDLKEGTDIIVQVTKEPYANKGARLTRNITIPGRYIVLVPYKKYIGISNKIEEKEDREKLKKVIQDRLPSGMGCVIRTASREVEVEDILLELEELIKIFEDIEYRVKNKNIKDKLIYSEVQIVDKVLRDYLDKSIEEIIVNDEDKYVEIKNFIENHKIYTDSKLKVKLIKGDVFKKYSISKDMEESTKRKVNLDSGGYIVIDETEALTAIDVNTGKFLGRCSIKKTLYDMNIEASKEIARQIRLRNIAGIIIIDFINMGDMKMLSSVVSEMEKSLKRDKMKTSIISITKLELVEITRKKSLNRLTSKILRSCPYCEGSGKIISEEAVVTDIQNELREISKKKEVESVVLEINYLIKEYIDLNKKSFYSDIKNLLDLNIYLLASEKIPFNELKIKRLGTNGYVGDYLYKNNIN